MGFPRTTRPINLSDPAVVRGFSFSHSPASAKLSPVVKQVATGLYYLLPNFGAFDLKVNAIYGLPLPVQGLLLTSAYFVVYVGILLSLSAVIFMRREMR